MGQLATARAWGLKFGQGLATAGVSAFNSDLPKHDSRSGRRSTFPWNGECLDSGLACPDQDQGRPWIRMDEKISPHLACGSIPSLLSFSLRAVQGRNWRARPMDPVHTDSRGPLQAIHRRPVLPNISLVRKDPALLCNMENWKESLSYPNSKKK